MCECVYKEDVIILLPHTHLHLLIKRLQYIYFNKVVMMISTASLLSRLISTVVTEVDEALTPMDEVICNVNKFVFVQ